MIVTFGKFRGQDSSNLPNLTGGLSYLKWGMNNLRSKKWRQEFNRVLASATSDDYNTRRAQIAHNTENSHSVAEYLNEYQAEEAQMDNELRQYDNMMAQAAQMLKNTGLFDTTPLATLERAVRNPDAVQFGNDDKEQAFNKAMAFLANMNNWNNQEETSE